MKIRCFTAILFTGKNRDAIADYRRRLELQLPDSIATINWEKQKNLHVTVNFLGDVEEKLLRNIILDTREKMIPPAPPVHLSIGNIGAFPSLHKPKILWIGCADHSHYLAFSHSLLNTIIKEVGKGAIPVESHAYTPHVTLGRIRSVHDFQKLTNVIMDFKEKTSFTCDEYPLSLAFMQSTLAAGGSDYSIIEEIPLQPH